uniref:DOP1-like C-terminal domain-containing protein n=1 Tax=Acrobeloides nanus TaxID=290746 RepID=A0A914EEG8_9BILA
MPLQGVIMTISDSLKEYNAVKQAKPGSPEKHNIFPTEVSLLELLHGCVKKIAPDELRECWSALNILFTESPLANLPPRAVFLEFIIFSDYVRICSKRQASRNLQDVCQKLTEAINNIVAWQLESTTWLKRTLVVRQDTGQKASDISPTMDVKNLSGSLASSEVNSIKGSTTSLITQNTRLSSFDGISSASQLPLQDKKSSSNIRASLKDGNNNKKDPANSTQALFLLAENLAELIDSICKSEDKEKLLPTLQAVWGNTLPYLRAKSARNARFFLASSQFLASISTFNYMRPVWKKMTLELLLDPAFFKMDMQSLRQWLIVIDNLMSNDKTSFKELLARIPTAPNTSLSSLITSKEQEYEMRAQALKRLAFVVLSSQMDQYSTQLPDIQERLSDSLRLAQVPVVHAQVFTCYRVLLIRMKPFNFVSMWPSMVTELIQVLIQIEQQLSGTSSTVSDDLKGSRDEQWMQLYLSACKLLETLCTLPSGYMAQFQMCHWAFISSLASNFDKDSFVPFTTRMHNLLTAKYGKLSNSEEKFLSASLFGYKTLMNFGELRPFFYALANQHKSLAAGITGTFQENQLRDSNFMNGSQTLKAAISRIEHSLYVDFAEHLQL